MLVSILAVSVWLWTKQGITPASAFRYSSFAVASIMTGTGFASSDYTQWGTFPVIFIFGLTFVGGCAGSTACGIKIFRFQILISTVRMEFRKLLDPHSVSIPYFGNRPISGEILSAVLGFFFLFMACFATLTMALAILGLDFTTAISSAATAMSNVGPGLGPIVGPSGTFESLPDMAKWLLAFGMLIGRLEVLTILTLFSRQIWRN
jgi:trk system potassium uptake protein TrkH